MISFRIFTSKLSHLLCCVGGLKMKEFFAVVTKQGTTRLRMEDILYFEKELRRIHVHTTDGVYSFYGSFGSLSERLDERFCRCHCSFVVNLEKVQSMKRYVLNLESGELLAISQRFYPYTKLRYLMLLHCTLNLAL